MVIVPGLVDLEGAFLYRDVGLNLQHMRHDLDGGKGILIGLDSSHVSRGQLVDGSFAGQEITNTLCTVAIEPYVGDVVGIVVVHDAVIGGNDEMLLRIVRLG